MPCFSNCLRAKLGDLLVLDGQDLRQHLDHRHLGAHGPVEAREFDADGARADDQQRFREAVRHHRLEIRPDLLLVGLKARQDARPRAGGDDDVSWPCRSPPLRALRRLDRRSLHALGRRRDWISPGLVILASPQIT